MIHRLICHFFGQHSMYRVYEEDYPDYAHMRCRYCKVDEWHSETGCLPLSTPWPKCPGRVSVCSDIDVPVKTTDFSPPRRSSFTAMTMKCPKCSVIIKIPIKTGQYTVDKSVICANGHKMHVTAELK